MYLLSIPLSEYKSQDKRHRRQNLPFLQPVSLPPIQGMPQLIKYDLGVKYAHYKSKMEPMVDSASIGAAES